MFDTILKILSPSQVFFHTQIISFHGLHFFNIFISKAKQKKNLLIAPSLIKLLLRSFFCRCVKPR